MERFTFATKHRRPALDAGLGFYLRLTVNNQSQGPHQVRADEGDYRHGA
jgi:hypothetical protein